MNIEFDISKYFNFLVEEYKFFPPVSYEYCREIHTNYIKDNIIIDIYFDGDYSCYIIKTKKIDKELLTGKIRVVDIDYKELKFYYLERLDKNEVFYNSLLNAELTTKKLLYYSSLIKSNPEILNGDFRKFSKYYKIFYKFKKNKTIKKQPQ